MLRDTDARRQGAGDAHSAELGKLLGPGAGDLELIHLLRSQTPLQHRKASLSACRARTRATKDGQRPAPRQCARWRPLRFRIDLAALDEVDATVRFDPAHDDQRDMRFKPAPLPTTAPGPTRPLAPSPMCPRTRRAAQAIVSGRHGRSGAAERDHVDKGLMLVVRRESSARVAGSGAPRPGSGSAPCAPTTPSRRCSYALEGVGSIHQERSFETSARPGAWKRAPAARRLDCLSSIGTATLTTAVPAAARLRSRSPGFGA